MTRSPSAAATASARCLRAEVRRLKTLLGRRRNVGAVLNVGDLGGARLAIPLERLGRYDDVALAGDVLTRAFARLGEPAGLQVWLTRDGRLCPGDADWRWRAATSDVRRRYGLPPGEFWVITRHGWLELPTLRTRTWARLRPTWEPPYDDVRAVEDADRPDPIEGWPIGF